MGHGGVVQSIYWSHGVTGAHEFVRVSREGKSYDLRNSIFGGIGSGAILGCLQGQVSEPFLSA